MGLGKSLKKAIRKVSSPFENLTKGLLNAATFGYVGQRKIAKAQSSAATSYAMSQERIAAEQRRASAIQAAQAGTTAVTATNVDNTAGVAEANVESANKRKRTVASTANRGYSGRVNSLLGLTGNGGRRVNL